MLTLVQDGGRITCSLSHRVHNRVVKSPVLPFAENSFIGRSLGGAFSNVNEKGSLLGLNGRREGWRSSPR